ncbi:hypothetical protein HZY97_05430 [Sphingomonas sp. R-74633]|uniref:hypothetical protein n=1 Tax=Sphingomonas sp. R-74633 TaxID=2751188 RepID=UPI0015D3D92A|nr:hypothetical protein [Sphingomonas sp. R-74633]NYT40187.1 hypothetical protein [Sphingomonas sp. R-74633]
MKLVLAAALAFLAPLPALAQTGPTTPTQKLPPANPLPYEDPEVAAVMTPINALFAAIARRDGQAALPYVRAEGRATATGTKPDGTPVITSHSWAEFAAGITPGPERFEERMTGPAVEIDGDIAMVWGDYVFLVDGKTRHCGVDHFDLVRDNGSWKILNVTWSRRTTGCPGQ